LVSTTFVQADSRLLRCGNSKVQDYQARSWSGFYSRPRATSDTIEAGMIQYMF
jgi:hypothetical protein